MQSQNIDDLNAVLGRATELVTELKAGETARPVGERPGFLVPAGANDPQPIIEHLASATQLTFVIGAGVSMEAGLPSWALLVRKLLERVAPKTLAGADRTAWLDAAAEPGPLGMAAMARALSGSDSEFVDAVESVLFDGKAPDQFQPGPLAREIAAWKQAYPDIRLATFNYDQLLESALTQAGLTATCKLDDEPEPEGEAYVRVCHEQKVGL